MPKLIHEYDLHADLTIDDVGARSCRRWFGDTPTALRKRKRC